MISAALVKELREITGAGMLDCKKALEETGADIEKAIDYLREKGISKAAKKAERIAAEGLAMALTNGNSAVILEVNSETDFVAKNEEFKEMINTIGNVILNSNIETLEEVLKLNVGEETIEELIVSKTAKIGEKLSFRRFERVTKEDNQVFGIYSHMGGKIVTLVVIENANEEVAKDVAMHVAAMSPLYISRNQVSSEEIEREREVLKEQAINEGKPAEIAEKMVEGRLQKFYKEICLEEQQFVKDPDLTVKDYVTKNNSQIKLTIRYGVGEGIEKRQDNFADEVMKQING